MCSILSLNIRSLFAGFMGVQSAYSVNRFPGTASTQIFLRNEVVYDRTGAFLPASGSYCEAIPRPQFTSLRSLAEH